MNKKDKFLFIVGVPFIIGLYILMADLFGGWGNLAIITGVMAVGFVVMGACMFAIIGIIYYLTIFRSSRYAKHLQEAGYAVYLHKHQIWQFATMALIGCIFTPIAVWITHRFYTIHTCFQAGECGIVEGWYFGAIFMAVMMWLMAGLGLFATVSMWWQSFRPLRRYYNDMQLGHSLDLPRLR